MSNTILIYITIALLTTWIIYFLDAKKGKTDSRIVYAVVGLLFPVAYVAIIITIVYVAVFGSAAYMAGRKKGTKQRRTMLPKRQGETK